MVAPTLAPHLSSSIVLTAFLSFVLSIGASLLAINLYSLLRTGHMGASWRVLTIATVIFSLIQAVKLFEIVFPGTGWNLSAIVEMIFIIALSYAFYLQRRVFMEFHTQRVQMESSDDENENEPHAISAYERYS